MRLLTLLLLLLTSLSFSTLQQQGSPQTGRASYYSDYFRHRKTASGERYRRDSFTAAHRTLPFGTLVRVTNLKNNLSVVVRINDRGPYSRRRIIDLSKAAARKIGMLHYGTTPVRIEVVNQAPTESKPGPENSVRPTDIKIYTYQIQAGAFHNYQNARNIRELLNQKGYNNTIIDSTGNSGGKLYKLLVGPYKTQTDAESECKKLNEQQIEAIVIVQ